jgi:hypothetical protein
VRNLLTSKFDVLLLSALLAFFAWYSLHGAGNFAERLTDTTLGALLGLITGRAIGGRHEEPNTSNEEIKPEGNA